MKTTLALAALAVAAAAVILVMTAVWNDPVRSVIPAGAITTGDLLKNPVYGTEVKVYGKVSVLGQVDCMCFYLTSGDGTISVWYSYPSANDMHKSTRIDIDGLQNGDTAVVVGRVNDLSDVPPSFWAINVTKLQQK
jgi:hypothetical protein